MKNETFGERIKRLREAKRLTQGDLAKLLKVSEKSVGNWELDKNYPRNSIGALREIFGDAIDREDVSSVHSDAVLAAIDESDLTSRNKRRLSNDYLDMLEDQQQEKGAAG